MKVLLFAGSDPTSNFIGVVFIFVMLYILFFMKPRTTSVIPLAPSPNNENNIYDVKSGELIRDTVPLDQAKYVRDRIINNEQETIPAQVYLLAECTDEQFNEYKQMQYPVKLGYFYKDGWTDGLPFYLFKCFWCSEFMVDYKHGHEPFLFCKSCEHNNHFHVYREINERHP